MMLIPDIMRNSFLPSRVNSHEYSLEMYVDEMDGALQSSMLEQMSIADASVATEANNKINQEVSARTDADASIAAGLSSELVEGESIIFIIKI